MDFSALGKWLVLAGLSLAAVGLLVWVLGRTGLPLGALPGDVRLQRDRFSFYFPIVTCLVVSIVLTVVLNILIRILRK